MAPPKRLVLKVLYEPDVQRHGTPDVDLVLVHGLNGDHLKTWTYGSGSSSVVWPRDLLPQKQPRTRVLSFGYSGDIYQNNSVAGIRGNARALLSQLDCRRESPDDTRPIIFLAHCLGGLIVKQALCFANNEREYESIASATRSIMLFGTPHYGAEKRQWLSIAKGFSPLGQAINGKPSALVDVLTRDSRELADISEDFCQLAPRYAITSFFETQVWPGTKECIVNATSAAMMIDNETRVVVDTDHVALCQFENDEDPTFIKTCKCIRDAIRSSSTARQDDGEMAISMQVETTPEVVQVHVARVQHISWPTRLLPPSAARWLHNKKTEGGSSNVEFILPSKAWNGSKY